MGVVGQEIDIGGFYPGEVEDYKVYFTGPSGEGKNGKLASNKKRKEVEIRIPASGEYIRVKVPKDAKSGKVWVYYGETNIRFGTEEIKDDAEGTLTLLEPSLEFVSKVKNIPSSQWRQYSDGDNDRILSFVREFYVYGYNLTEDLIEAVYLYKDANNNGKLEDREKEVANRVIVTTNFSSGETRWVRGSRRFEGHFVGTVERQTETLTAWVVIKLRSGEDRTSTTIIELLPPLSVGGALIRAYLGNTINLPVSGFSVKYNSLNRVTFHDGKVASVLSVSNHGIKLKVPEEAPKRSRRVRSTRTGRGKILRTHRAFDRQGITQPRPAWKHTDGDRLRIQ